MHEVGGTNRDVMGPRFKLVKVARSALIPLAIMYGEDVNGCGGEKGALGREKIENKEDRRENKMKI